MADEPRVASDDVLAIIDTEVEDITPFITVAHLLVEEILATSGLSEDMLKEIERWLTAHFVAVRDPRPAEDQIGDARTKYTSGAIIYAKGVNDLSGLIETPYGKQVIVLDTTGLLASTINRKKASFAVLGYH